MSKVKKWIKPILLMGTALLLGYCGWLSMSHQINSFKASAFALLPSLVAIVLALVTKEVYSSLFIGVLSGALLLSNFDLLKAMLLVVDKGFISVLGKHENLYILIFLVILGIIVTLMNKSGGAKAFGDYSLKKITSKLGASLMTIIMGMIIFIDDYFNCLTVGSIMQPVCDEHQISRAKLAYIIDATAAPICVLAPISSWAAAVAGFVSGSEGFRVFIESIPYNFYAILTIVMMLGLVFSKIDYAKMAEFEQQAEQGCDHSKVVEENSVVNENGKVIDLLFPVIILIINCFIGLIYTGGFFNGVDLFEAFANCNGGQGLVYGSFISLIIIMAFYLVRRSLSFNSICESVSQGFQSIVSAILILILAWSLKEMCDMLAVGDFIKSLMENQMQHMVVLLPMVIFIVSLFMAFATGSSWGTFGILIPIVIAVFKGGEMLPLCLSACMAGAVCGDHCSPISDTTIMASTGAKCNHLDHVVSQLYYVAPVAIVSAILYGIIYWIKNPFICLLIGAVILLSFLYLQKYKLQKQG